MRALTLTQPWAGIVASGIKLVENRPRHMIKREDFGKPFAIHASKVIDEDVITHMRRHLSGFEDVGETPLWRVTGAVVAVATVDSVLDPLACGIMLDHPDAVAPLPHRQRRWFTGRIGYVLRDVHALAAPVPCRGFQGFWTLPADAEAAVRAQLGEVIA